MCEFCSLREQDDDKDSVPRAVGPMEASRLQRTDRSRNYTGSFQKTPGRLFGMGLVRLYQLTLSGFIGNSCRHIPTCSEYSYEAIARYGLWPGSWMTLFRVGRCGPGGTSGLDPVPETLGERSHWWTPWRYFAFGSKSS